MRTLLLIIVCTAASIAGTVFYLEKWGDISGSAQIKETAYDRVIRTGTIRCGYATAEPWIYIDPNTKEMRGIAVEVIEAAAKTLNLKVEWAEDTGWTGVAPSLNEGRTDVGCASLWLFAAKSREIMYSIPYVYNAIHAYTRADETRFKTFDDINQPGTRIVLMEGELTSTVSKDMFPLASSLPLTATTPISDFYLSIATHKADIFPTDPFAISSYNKSNEKQLVRIPLPEPLLSIGASFPVGKNEIMLKHMIDSAIMELQSSGQLKRIIDKYNADAPGSLYLPAAAYQKEP